MLWMGVFPASALRLMPEFEPSAADLSQIARTLTVLNGRPAVGSPPHLRVLFYGQSITLQGWWISVANWLKQAYPQVQFEIENRAISGFQAELLAKTAETDVAQFSPDLILLHCYGDEPGTDKLLEVLRSTTSADILVQQDHPHLPDQRYETVDPDRLTILSWWAYRNYVWLPRLCAKHRCGLLRVRDVWKAYLLKHGLVELDLLQDSTHMNSEGNQLLTTIITTYLKQEVVGTAMDPENTSVVSTAQVDLEDPLDPWTVTVPFVGRRVEAWMDPSAPGAYSGFNASVTVDGLPVAHVPGSVQFTRSSFVLGYNWPAILRFTSTTNLVPQDWKAVLTEVGPQATWCRFQVEGSVTGMDGEGISSEPFVSTSGQVRIDPRDWMIPAAAANSKMLPEVGFEIHWKAQQGTAERFAGNSRDIHRLGERLGWVLLADGLPDGPHQLQLVSNGSSGPGLIRFRALSPSGTASVGAAVTYQTVGVPDVRIRRKGSGHLVIWPAVIDGKTPVVDWTPSMGSGQAWEPYPPEGEPFEGRYTRRIPVDSSVGFFRLRVP